MKLLNIRTSLIAAAIGLVGLSGAVLSQSAPQVPFLNPTDLIQVIPNGQPGPANQYTVPAKITNTIGYYKSGANAATAGTYTYGSNVTFAMFQNSGTITSLYVTLAANPSDGSRNCMFAIGAITFIYVAANTGQSINNAITTLSALSGACYTYSLSNATWDRS